MGGILGFHRGFLRRAGFRRGFEGGTAEVAVGAVGDSLGFRMGFLRRAGCRRGCLRTGEGVVVVGFVV